jgi:phosphoserine phosphatase
MSRQTPVVAFFDMDKTILSESSGLLWVDYMRRTGRIGLRHVLYISWLALQYKLAVMNYASATARLMPVVAGQGEDEVWAMCREWFDEMIVPCVTGAAVRRIEEHRREGHIVAVLSAATVYVVKLLADYLELGDNFLCTDLAHTFFYTDSHTDLALLEHVGYPVAVNPDIRLRRLAQRRGWPVERFH